MFLKNKKLLMLIILLICVISIANYSIAMTHFQVVGTTTGLVTATTLNVRQGPGTNFKIVTQVYKNQYIRVFAKIGDWYVVQLDNDYIGTVSSKYVKLIYPTGGATESTEEVKSQSVNDEQEVLDLINAKRIEAGLNALTMDAELQNVARAKAQDMVDKSYFSHTSPTYGSPFDMMKSFGITYKTAGENIAGNSSNTGAVNAWMNSEGHRANILSNSYNYTGIGVVKSPIYGKIYVQMFIGK